MRRIIENSDREFLGRLHRLGRSTVQQICDELNVTATAVRQRLVRLQSGGFVVRDVVREGRGRPHHVYRITQAARRELGDNYGDLALILWRELQGIDDLDLKSRVEERVRDAMIAQFGGEMSDLELGERFDQLAAALTQRGFDVEVDHSQALPILRENNCPYHELADEDRGICEMEEDVFGQVLGVPVKLTRCCLEGHGCCEFELAEAAPAGAAT